MSVPYWVQDAIFYQIFPERYADGDPTNNPVNAQPWGEKPTIWGFQGGDLRGIIQRFNHLLDLGVTAIYLNPIFQSPSNHRYNITDYYRIDPKLGDINDFKALMEVAHRNEIRIILDGVFNHCGRGFFAFNDVLENQEHSPYLDWFHIQNFPVDGYSVEKVSNYKTWWRFKSLPKFNTDNINVRRFIFDVARHWIEQGADGWRLDVPNEIDDDSFWDEFRHEVKLVNSDAYLVGEIWDGDPRWVDDHHFDALMHYPIRDALLEFLKGEQTVCDFGNEVERYLEKYPHEHVYAMYVPLGSHDTRRLMTELEGNLEKVKLAFLFQFAYPGAPAIYYGDEIGLEGEKDPDCRRAFPWEQSQWNTELHSWVRKLVSTRRRLTELRRGGYRHVLMDKRRCCYAFARTLGERVVLIAMNGSPSRRHLRLPVGDMWSDGRIVRDLLWGEEYIVSGDQLVLTLQPWSGVWIA